MKANIVQFNSNIKYKISNKIYNKKENINGQIARKKKPANKRSGYHFIVVVSCDDRNRTYNLRFY